MQINEAASILRFLSEAEWRLVRQASRDLGGGFAPVQTPYPQVSCGPEQSGAVREGSFVEEVSKLYEITIAVGLVEHDERFSSFEYDFLGDELVRWDRSGEACGHYPGEAVDDLGAWLVGFLLHAESLCKRVTNLSVGLSHEQGRKTWAALESEVAALRRISGGSGSPAGSEAAGRFALSGQGA